MTESLLGRVGSARKFAVAERAEARLEGRLQAAALRGRNDRILAVSVEHPDKPRATARIVSYLSRNIKGIASRLLNAAMPDGTRTDARTREILRSALKPIDSQIGHLLGLISKPVGNHKTIEHIQNDMSKVRHDLTVMADALGERLSLQGADIAERRMQVHVQEMSRGEVLALWHGMLEYRALAEHNPLQEDVALYNTLHGLIGPRWQALEGDDASRGIQAPVP